MYHFYYDRDARPITNEQWMALMAQGNRTVAYTDLGLRGRVSTVWLGLNHAFDDGDAPLIYETLVFDGPLADAMERYTTLDQARTGHEFMIMRLTTLAGFRIRPLIHNGGRPRRSR